MKITRETVLNIARLSRLRLSDEEVEAQRHDLTQILAYVAKLDELDTSDVEPTAHAVETSMRFREDVVEERLTREDVLLNAPAVQDHMFQVPKIIEG
jgi:aspartyl-tRNA(Asn)/glutamyl-tRNA(Gln) amidotransferase subunit C